MDINNHFNKKNPLLLIVEYKPAICDMLYNTLKRNYRLQIVNSVDEALDFIHASHDDVAMVLFDYKEVLSEDLDNLSRIKQDEDTVNIPVIVLTKERSLEIECFQLGASDYIWMPCEHPDVVAARVRHILKSSKKNLSIKSGDADELTGIFKQDAFFECAEEFDLFHPKTEMDAVCVDIRNFHIFNDRYGRQAGDLVLIAMAKELRKIAIQENGITGRKAADVFLLYLPHREDYTPILDRLQKVLEKKGKGNEESKEIRLKMSVYPAADKTMDVRSRFDRAKLALDTIHYSYSQMIVYYDSELYRQNLEFQQLMQELDDSLRNHDFKVYYQPKFRIKGGEPELVSAEALIRWHHPTKGILFPGTFVPLFEDNGLITRLDRYVWEEAAAQIRGWRDKYGFTLPVSVNASSLDMQDDDLTDFLLETVSKNGIDPEDLLLEITESAYTKNIETLVGQIKRLRSAGFRIEMDDFGSGYSSLNMLSSLDIDYLKLDISFIRNMFSGDKNFQMLRLLMQIKDALNIPIVAEGVETWEQLNLLKEIGCDIVQGYYFSKPVLPDEFETFIEQKMA